MTGRIGAALLACVLVALVSGSASAQVQVTASLDMEQIPVGHGLRFTVTVIGADREIVPPTLPDLPGVSSFSAGQSQRFSFVNGQSRAEYSWSWSLVPRREGEVTIPAIKVVVDGRDFETPPRTFVATPARTPPEPGAAPGGEEPAAEVPDAFVTMKVDQDTVVLGQQVVLTFGFYRASRTSMFESPEYTAPRTEGFWREDLPPERHRREVIRSQRYEVTEIQYALFPTRTGDLEISEATVRLPDDAFGNFFRRNQRRRGPSILRTEPITVHVRSLPVPQPADFSGTVATGLRLRSSVDRRELEQGDALTWRVRLDGTGHLEAAALPVPDLGPGFTVHESSSAAESGPDGGRLRGSRTVEYLVIPQQPGDLTIPALDYSWYDADRMQYARARTQAIPIKVTPSEGAVASVFTGGRKSEIELLARDILHIEPVSADVQPWAGPLPGRTVFWAAAGGVPLLWGLSALASRRRRQLLADPQRLRARRARASAMKVLDADRPADQRVAAAVEGYVADRFDRSASGLVRDEIESILRAGGVADGLVAETRGLLDRCDAIRFAPGTSAAETLVADARRLIDQLEEVLRA